MISRDLNKRKNKAFLWCAAKYGRDWLRYDQNEQNFTYKALVAFKKSRIYLFSRLHLYFLCFSRSGKLLGKFQDFFKNSRHCTNPEYLSLNSFVSHSWTNDYFICRKISEMNLRQAALTQTMHGYSSTTIKRFAMKLYLTVAGKKARNISKSLQSCIFTKSTLYYKYCDSI